MGDPQISLRPEPPPLQKADETLSAVAHSLGSQDERAPLRIHHFLLWITITALFLSWSYWIIGSWNADYPDPQIGRSVAQELPNIGLTGLFTISLCVVWWRAKGRIRVVQPGEWTAILASIDSAGVLLSSAAAIALYRFYNDADGIIPEELLLLPNIIIDLLVMALICRLLWRRGESGWWKAFYALFATQKLLGYSMLIAQQVSVHYLANMNAYALIYMWGTNIFLGLLVGAALTAACRDLIQRRQRRWTHWAGAIIYVLITLYYGVLSLLAFNSA